MSFAAPLADAAPQARAMSTVRTIRPGKIVPFAMLVLLGCVWGLVMPLSSMAMARRLEPFALSTAVSAVGALTFLALSLRRGRLQRLTLRELGYFALWALVSVAGQCLLFFVIRYVPSSTISVISILDGLMVFVLAAFFRLEAASPKRLLGLAAGFGGLAVMLGVADPAASPVGAITILALGVPLSYAAENLLISSRWPSRVDACLGLGIMQAIATLISGSLVLIAGGSLSIPPAADRSLVLLICVCVAFANWLLQALVRRSGPVFASQNSYLVTIAGIGWSVLLLGEALPPSFWLGLAAVLLGVFIVQPRAHPTKSPASPIQHKVLT